MSDTDRHIDHWRAADNQCRVSGKLPLADGELLPAGALGDEPPDEDRLLEAIGSEGVSFERAYRRAVWGLWPRTRQVDVLVQAGTGSELAVQEMLVAADGASADALDMAGRIMSMGRSRARATLPVERGRCGLARCAVCSAVRLVVFA